MNITQRLHYWHDAHPVFHLILRVILGVFLLLKGIYFISHSEQLQQMLQESGFAAWNVFLVSYIPFAHIFGGIFIVVGLLTRIAVLLQLPVLIGAVFFINLGLSSFSTTTDLVLSILVLVLLVYFLIYGNGEYSMDDYLKKNML